MSAHLDPIAQVTQRATDALVRELGVVDAIRFLGQFRAGNGDFTAQRQALLEEVSVRELAAQIKSRRAKTDSDPRTLGEAHPVLVEPRQQL